MIATCCGRRAGGTSASGSVSVCSVADTVNSQEGRRTLCQPFYFVTCPRAAKPARTGCLWMLIVRRIIAAAESMFATHRTSLPMSWSLRSLCSLLFILPGFVLCAVQAADEPINDLVIYGGT